MNQNILMDSRGGIVAIPNVKTWVQERIIFMAMVIFVFGAGSYIGAGKIFSPDNIWLHPFKEFALLIAMVGVVSFGYEILLLI